MPYCPECRYEYKEGVFRCPECDQPLVESLSDMIEGEESYKDWIALAKLTSLQFAEMLEESLRNSHVPVVILRGTGFFGKTGQMGMTSFQPAGGVYTVMVPREYVGDADAHGQSIMGEDWVKARLVDIDED